MTRLADALERANARAGGPAPAARPAGSPVHAAAAPAPALALVNAPPESDARLAAGPSLLGAAEAAERAGRLAHRSGADWQAGRHRRLLGRRARAVPQARGPAAPRQVERGLKVVMTSSALPGEGKSLTAVNTALTLSESYQRRVLLIDADLRRPTIQRIFGLPPVSGLSEILKSNDDTPMTVTQMTERLFVLPAGRPDSDPISGLTSQRMQRVLAHAAAMFDWVLVDTPPLGLLPDAGLLTSFVGGVLLVVRCGKAPYSLVRRTVDAVTRERILGVIMNAVDLAHDKNAGGYYEYYGYGYTGTPDKK